MKEKTLYLHRQYVEEVDALIRSLEVLDRPLLHRKPKNGGWSAMQVLYHLVLVEEHSIAYLRKKLSFKPELPKSGIGAAFRSLLLNISLQLPGLKFKAPKAAASDRIPEQGDLAEIQERWLKTCADWRDFLEQMPDLLPEKALYRHPRAGMLNLDQTIRFLQGHFRRHRRQIMRSLK